MITLYINLFLRNETAELKVVQSSLIFKIHTSQYTHRSPDRKI